MKALGNKDSYSSVSSYTVLTDLRPVSVEQIQKYIIFYHFFFLESNPYLTVIEWDNCLLGQKLSTECVKYNIKYKYIKLLILFLVSVSGNQTILHHNHRTYFLCDNNNAWIQYLNINQKLSEYWYCVTNAPPVLF